MYRQDRITTSKMPVFSPVARSLIQRQCACGQHTPSGGECETCREERGGVLQRQTLNAAPARGGSASGVSAPSGAMEYAPNVVQQALHESGQPLDRETRVFMEPRFGHDFSRVRVHTDGRASASAQAVNALAYTVGQDVVFGAGQYAPATTAGRKLLAHELTHIAQQNGVASSSSDTLTLDKPDDPAEHEATRTADAVMQGSARLQDFQRQSALRLQRRSKDGDDPIHKPLIDKFRKEQGLPPGGIDETGQAVGPSDAQIKYRDGPKEAADQDMEARASALESKCDVMGLCILSKVSPKIVPTQRVRAAAQKCVPDKLGYIGQDVCKLPQFDPYRLHVAGLPVGAAGGSSTPTPKPASATPSPSPADLTPFTFNTMPVVNLPKSLTAKLPGALGTANAIVLELKAFSFSATWSDEDISVKATGGLDVNTSDASKSKASGGLEITTTRKVCNAVNPAETRAKITAAGEKLTPAMQNLTNPPKGQSGEDRLKLLTDVVGAIGDMYDAVDKAKSVCKPVPLVTFGLKGEIPANLGTKDPGNATPPSGLPPAKSIGVTATFHF